MASLVSLIVLNYNGAASIVRCLESIEVQSYSEIETIVVDNDSKDNSMSLVEDLFPKVKTIRNSRNLGFAEGNNVGIRVASGELIVLVNNDLVMDKDAIQNMITGMTSRAGILGGVVYYFYSKDIWAYGGCLEPLTGMHWQAFQGMPNKTILPQKMNVDYVPGALLMIRRTVLEQIGLLNSFYFLYGDDIDLACNVRRLGYTVEVISSVVSYHIVSQSVKALNKQHELRGYYLMNRNMFYLYFTQLPLIFSIASVASQLVFSFFEISVFKRRFTYATVKIAALSHLLLVPGRIRSERKRLKALGKIAYKTQLKELLKLARSRGLSRIYYW